MGRVFFALSRAGYLPRWISLTSKQFKTPHLGLIIGGISGFIVALILDLVGTGIVGAALLNMALLACFTNPDYRPGVYGVAISLLANIAYFALFSRHRLVAQAPEEEVALMTAAQQELKH